MNDRLRIAALALILSVLACSQASNAPSVAGGPPTRTPPPIPTRPQATPTAEGGTEAAGGAASPDNQTMAIVYGSARGDSLGIYYLSTNFNYIASQPLGDAIKAAVWPAPSPDSSKIAFVSLQSDLLINGIFLLNRADGSVTQLTHGDGAYPQFSPEGTRIAYTCNVNNLNDTSKADVCVMNADGSGSIDLTQGSKASNSYPHWTPDGHIVFMSNRGLPTNGLFSEIYIMNGDGTGVTQLTNDKKFYNANPAVSPDGSKIVFESNKEVAAGSELYVMNIDGTARIRITNDSLWNQNPVWAPDGQHIMYAADDGKGNIDLWQINPDGSSAFRLTHIFDEDGGLRLGHAYLPKPFVATTVRREDEADVTAKPPSGSSPVTNGVLFASNSFNCTDCMASGIYFVTFDGAQTSKLPNINGFFPAWAPQFQRFAFVQDGEIYLANADSSGVTKLTHGMREFTTLQWNQRGNQILATCQPYGQLDTCIVDANTGAIQNITENLTYGPGTGSPTWISDERILLGQVIMDATGVQVGSIGAVGKARYSPDGSQIAGIKSRQVVLADATGNVTKTLTTDASTKTYPIWSPDGTLLIYSQAPGDGKVYLYAIRADGANGPYKLAKQPIAAGPTTRPDILTVYFGYSWAP